MFPLHVHSKGVPGWGYVRTELALVSAMGDVVHFNVCEHIMPVL